MGLPRSIAAASSLLELRLESPFAASQRPFLPHRSSHRCLGRRSTLVSASKQDNRSLSQLEREVPPDQRPVNELQQLKDSALYSWVRSKVLTILFYFKETPSLYKKTHF